jgi:lipoprotein Spr/probable lipoprotein NlpC
MQKQILLFYFLSTFLFVACSSRKNLSSSKNNTAVVQKYARMMDVPKKKIKNPELYQFIDDWIGTKYQYGGLSKNGIDCSGFTYLLYKEVYDKTIPRNTSGQVDIIKRKYEGQLKEGDLVFFDYDKKKFSHVGVFLQNGYYVHASTRKGVMVQKLKDPYTYKYFSRGGSIK